MKFRIFLAWYDFWIGFFYDREKDILYVCLLPMIVMEITFYFHYQIIGGYSGNVIGYCAGYDAKQDVLTEEPEATFRRIPTWQYHKELEDW